MRELLSTSNPARLRLLLAAFLLALAVPSAFLIWQAFGQLKWESFHLHRTMAEELTDRIDAQLIERINRAEARTASEFEFLVVTGDSESGFVQRSPLSGYPVDADVPGTLGYFEVGEDGRFTTPLLPADGTPADAVGLTGSEIDKRRLLAAQLLDTLRDNSLVRPRVTAATRFDDLASVLSEDEPLAYLSRDKSSANESNEEAPAAAGSVVAAQQPSAGDRGNRNDPVVAEPETDTYSQAVFDNLNRPSRTVSEAAAATPSAPADADAAGYRKVAELNLDETLEKKSEARDSERRSASAINEGFERERRVEQSARAVLDLAGRSVAGNLENARVLAFESEIDPYEFSLLDSGHFVLFRRVRQNGEQVIQGALIDRRQFVDEAIAAAFDGARIAGMADLVVAYQDNVVATLTGAEPRTYGAGTAGLDGSVLYRDRLSAPLDQIELIYSITRLPAGPGARVLVATSAVLGLVLLGGTFALYRIGVAQIRLGRQQQDFVSAVSHELKTPLTSIRMYGEILKEGWASDDKKQGYYAYIHDEAERLTRLIQNVLQLASIAENDESLSLAPASVNELLDLAHSKIANQVEHAGFELSVEIDERIDGAVVSADTDAFVQIVINLIDNAIKFSRDAETRRLELRAAPESPGNVVFSIRDYGPGIPPQQIRKIFKLFYRLESELTRETVGTGIGLAIVHQLTNAMNGRIDVRNRDPGAEFRIMLPLLVDDGQP